MINPAEHGLVLLSQPINQGINQHINQRINQRINQTIVQSRGLKGPRGASRGLEGPRGPWGASRGLQEPRGASRGLDGPRGAARGRERPRGAARGLKGPWEARVGGGRGVEICLCSRFAPGLLPVCSRPSFVECITVLAAPGLLPDPCGVKFEDSCEENKDLQFCCRSLNFHLW